MIAEPKWAKEMFDVQAKFSIKVFEYLYDNGLKFDGVFLGNDMGYKNHSLFSPAFYKELIFPSDKLMCDHFHNMDAKVILHSDGNITKLIPDIIKAGFDCIQPIEVKAGMDPVNIRKEYGDKIALWGGIDTRIISSNNFKESEKEIVEKFTVLKKEGGYIYQSDHSIPDNIGFLQYKNFLEIVNRYRDY
jgi:uroporphyrinogen decarboxylase